MNPGSVSPEQLKQNRKTAVIFGTVSVATLILQVFIIVNYFPEAREDLTWIIFSFLAYMIVAAIVGGLWIKRRKRRQQELKA